MLDRAGAAEDRVPQQTNGPSKRRSLPLSLAQRQLWFMEALQSGGSAYNNPTNIRMRGRLDVPKLEASIAAVVDRQEALRTRLPAVDGIPEQVVETEVDVSLTIADLTASDLEHREGVIREHIDATAQRPFDVQNGPLFRVELLRISALDHVLVMCVHHLVSDALSIALVLEEIGAHYRTFTTGEPLCLPKLGRAYRDYALAQNELLVGDQIEFWRRRFEDCPAALELPLDRTRPATNRYHGRLHVFEVEPELVERAAKLASVHGTTIFVCLLASYAILLWKYTGQDDLVVGVPMQTRPDESYDAVVGCFVSTVPVRIRLDAESNFEELVETLSDEVFENFDNLDVPLDEIVKIAGIERDASVHPLIQTTFGLLTAEQSKGLDLGPDISSDRITETRLSAKFDLSLDLFVSGAEVRGEIEYNDDLFEDSTVAAMAGHWTHLLNEALAKPTKRLSGLSVMSPDELHRALHVWNNTGTEPSETRCLHEAFEHQARETPDAVAVVSGSHRVTYEWLDNRANQLAKALRVKGIGVEHRVGICLPRSTDGVVAVLAVLKAGGCFVTFDPDYPSDRLRAMFADAELSLLLSTRELLGIFELAEVPSVLLDEKGWLDGYSACPVQSHGVSTSNLACLIYTSGSTGRPKCAMLTHHNLLNYFYYFERRHQIRSVVRAHLQTSSFAFDLFIADIMRALFVGATLVLCERDVVLSPAKLYGVMVRESVNSAEFVPPLLRALVEHVESEGMDLSGMDLLMAGGDVWYARDYLRTRNLCREGVRLVGTYGLTEAAIDNAQFAEDDLGPELDTAVPIGRPIANTRLYILDDRMRLVPPGVTGELFVGGEGVGRGYFENPASTADRFVPDPFSADGGARLYRTGDRTRFRKDGNIEILGRTDNQVKVRGFRVEMGEVEACLQKITGVRQAAVVASPGADGGAKLVAYVVLSARPEVTERPALEEVWQAAEDGLPSFMVPSRIIPVERIPLTSNGKLDRRALPAATISDGTGARAIGPPRGPIEELVRDIWADLLNTKHIGLNDNFFRLGGHSLLLTQVQAKLQKIAQVDIPIRDLYQNITVAKLARQVELARSSGIAGRDLGARPERRAPGDSFAPSFSQERLWFLHQLAPEDPAYNSLTVFRLSGPIDHEALRRSFESLIERHHILRTVYAEVGGGPVQVLRETPTWLIPVYDMSGIAEEARAELVRDCITKEEVQPFDLANGPMMRTVLVKLADDVHLFLLNMHHIVTDGWSEQIFFEELELYYRWHREGVPTNLPDATFQYGDFAVWQRAICDEESIADGLRYWTGQLASCPPVANFPLDHPRPDTPDHRGACIDFTIPPELTDRLKSFARQSGASLFMVVLASFQATLNRFCQQDDIVVGTPVANRQRAEFERTIGYLSNTLAFRANFSTQPSWRDLVDQVRANALDGYAYQEVPFSRVVEALNPGRNMGHHPVFQVLLAVQTVDESRSMRLSGLEADEVEFTSSVSQFDLSVSVDDVDGRLIGRAWYKRALFEPATIIRIVDVWQGLLDAALTTPECPLARLHIEDADVTRRESNYDDGNTEREPVGSIAEVVRQRAASTPDRVAVTRGDSSITYSKLAALADSLAGYLRGCGVGQEMVVALLLEPSIEFVVAQLGVLQAGAGYVPLDAGHPAQRLHQVIEESDPALILAGRDVPPPPIRQHRTVVLDDALAQGPALGLAAAAFAESTAYVMYTSGSSGVPKGVVVPHGALLNHAEGVQREFGLTGDDRVLQCRPTTFDASVEEILPTLSAGATLLIEPTALHHGFGAFATQCAATGVTVASLPTAFWSGLVSDREACGLLRSSALRLLFAAGEKVAKGALQHWKDSIGESIEFMNVYGVTEATITSTVHKSGAEWADRSAFSVPIGTPIPKVEAYVLDREMCPVPRGVVGELYIGGGGLARCYLERPAETAERYVPNPFALRRGARLYRTGDLVRRRIDGQLEYVGRSDRQLKVRGFRIEPGEIERTILACESATGCAVEVEGTAENQRLLAFVESKDPTLSHWIKSFVEARLPSYLSPDQISVVPELPLNANGKVDRALLDTVRSTLQSETDPQTSTAFETVIGKVWAAVLTMEHIGVDDDFFELGGHSLLAAKLVAALRRGTDVELPVRALFDNPTVRTMARHVEGLVDVGVRARILELAKGTAQDSG